MIEQWLKNNQSTLMIGISILGIFIMLLIWSSQVESNRIDQVEERLDSRLDRVEQRLDERLERLEEKVDLIQRTLDAQAANR